MRAREGRTEAGRFGEKRGRVKPQVWFDLQIINNIESGERGDGDRKQGEWAGWVAPWGVGLVRREKEGGAGPPR